MTNAIIDINLICQLVKRILIVFCMLVVSAICAGANIDMPCVGTATAVLNVRSGPGTGYSRIGLLSDGETIHVRKWANADWLEVEYNGRVAYVHSDYVELSPSPVKSSNTVRKKNISLGRVFWDIFKGAVLLCVLVGLLDILLKVLAVSYVIIYKIITILSRIISFPFFFLNGMQRYLAKPWFVFFKDHHFDSRTNAVLRKVFFVLKIPLYFLLIPLRAVNAIYFNMVMHCLFEMFNYTTEVISPSNYKEGYDHRGRWLLMFPWRVLKYVVWHGTLTVTESLIWTVVDIFIPALTLYHGTTPEAANAIVSSPDRGACYGFDVGIWRVGTGNYAGNGIYFAPARSTARHYSSGSLIICRVTLGPTLDLGLAPYYVFSACGRPNAVEATSWGLENGYVTGEWWRPDEKWWEYCMYDWQNRYNFSWRIRPLYVLDLDSGSIQRIPGGMCHWLFRRMVIRDIFASS